VQRRHEPRAYTPPAHLAGDDNLVDLSAMQRVGESRHEELSRPYERTVQECAEKQPHAGAQFCLQGKPVRACIAEPQRWEKTERRAVADRFDEQLGQFVLATFEFFRRIGRM
jgi:hypothetical protein